MHGSLIWLTCTIRQLKRIKNNRNQCEKRERRQVHRLHAEAGAAAGLRRHAGAHRAAPRPGHAAAGDAPHAAAPVQHVRRVHRHHIRTQRQQCQGNGDCFFFSFFFLKWIE